MAAVSDAVAASEDKRPLCPLLCDCFERDFWKFLLVGWTGRGLFSVSEFIVA